MSVCNCLCLTVIVICETAILLQLFFLMEWNLVPDQFVADFKNW